MIRRIKGVFFQRQSAFNVHSLNQGSCVYNCVCIPTFIHKTIHSTTISTSFCYFNNTPKPTSNVYSRAGCTRHPCCLPCRSALDCCKSFCIHAAQFYVYHANENIKRKTASKWKRRKQFLRGCRIICKIVLHKVGLIFIYSDTTTP